jgi:organic hydroperoxide reductase OsmC/OhrA
VVASVPEVHAKKFEHIAQAAKAKCPISRALKIPIQMTLKQELQNNLAAV